MTIDANYLEMLIEHMDAEVYNHSPHVDADFVTISACSDPAVAYNNCHAVSSELAEIAGIPQVRVDFSNGTVHYANSDCGQVVDYTARQYDPTADFPLMIGLDEWISNAVKKVYPDTFVIDADVECDHDVPYYTYKKH